MKRITEQMGKEQAQFRSRLNKMIETKARRLATFLTRQSERLTRSQKKIILLLVGLLSAGASVMLVLSPLVPSLPEMWPQALDSTRVEAPMINGTTLKPSAAKDQRRVNSDSFLDSLSIKDPKALIYMIKRGMKMLDTTGNR